VKGTALVLATQCDCPPSDDVLLGVAHSQVQIALAEMRLCTAKYLAWCIRFPSPWSMESCQMRNSESEFDNLEMMQV